MITFAPIHFSTRHLPVIGRCFVMHSSPEDRIRGTVAAIVTPEGRIFLGTAICSPSDQFVKSVGRAKALGRAFRAVVKDNDYFARINFASPNPVQSIRWTMRCELERAIREVEMVKGQLEIGRQASLLVRNELV